jgi:hypothetical protein
MLAARGLFAPTSVDATPDSVTCNGMLRLPGGGSCKAQIAICRRRGPERGIVETGRFLYGFGVQAGGDSAEAAGRAQGSVRALLLRIASREDLLAPLWDRATRTSEDDPLVLEFPEELMGGPIPRDAISAAASSKCRTFSVGIHLRWPCLQRCAFCRPEPRTVGMKEAREDLAFVRTLCREIVRPSTRRGVQCRFRLEADDLAGHPFLGEICRALNRESGAPLNLVMPGNRLADPGHAKRIARPTGVETVMLSLFGSTARTHDGVAGRRGAFAEVIAAARNLSAHGTVSLAFNAVLTARGIRELGGILETARRFGARLVISGLFADYPRHHELIRPIVPDAASVRKALEREAAAMAALGARVEDLPVCAIPMKLRPRAGFNRGAPFHDYPRLEKCEPCIYRSGCVGVPRGYLDAHGARHLRPETAPAGG